ncbi:MAG: DNA starvation/stationary phase protection protein Dps [Dehalococcoidia bacterium]|nr:DNA starvation/stationary phase protection protein Dps [Dehalococcoidia bacterium]
MASKNGSTKTKTRPAATGNATVIEGLNARLADLIDLHWQLKQAHWNVTGPNFIAVHELFDEQATAVRAMADTVAERVRALQAAAEGTVRYAVERSTLDDFPSGLVDWEQAITQLVDRYEQCSAQFQSASDVAAEADDKATEDLYVEMIRQIDQFAYFLRAHAK